jgi:hypothetical protein
MGVTGPVGVEGGGVVGGQRLAPGGPGGAGSASVTVPPTVTCTVAGVHAGAAKSPATATA